MIEYVSVEKLVNAHIRAEKDPYTMGWNDGIQNALEKKNITRAVPEEAFKVVKKLLEGWKNETRYKKELAIADHDTATADIKRTDRSLYEGSGGDGQQGRSPDRPAVLLPFAEKSCAA